MDGGFKFKRITLFAGHYGSGKTNLAVNAALSLRRTYPRVALADLDIVNPYFRSLDSAAVLVAHGIELVVSEFANSNVDFPAMPKETYALLAEADRRVVIDVGGDDRGALALGRYVEDIRASGDYDMLAVINSARPLTRDSASAVEVIREIEAASRLPFTGIVNNTNLGPETTAETVLESAPYAEAIARELKLPICLTAFPCTLKAELEGKVPNPFPLEIQKLYYHQLDSCPRDVI